MAYDLKYQSDFYNYFHKLVSVKIYKKDYGGHAPIMLRTVEVTIEVNFQDENTPVIGTGAKVNIINQGEFTSLEDLLVSTEKEFLCTIEYDGGIVFRGFSMCDLNEQEFLPLSNITLQFVDYLRRLEKDYLDLISDMGENSSVIAIIRNALVVILGGSETIPLYVNSTLFETTMDNNSDGTITLFEQLWVSNYMFYTSPLAYDALNKVTINNYDTTYTVLNKILLSLGAFLYSNGTDWILERQEDVMRTGDWVLYPDVTTSVINGEPIGSLKEEYNKQNGDFEYVGTSQVLEYASGLQKLELNLKDNQLESLVFNDYNKDDFYILDTVFPNPGDLIFHQWYRYTNTPIIRTDYDYRTMVQYMEWQYEPSVNPWLATAIRWGVYYKFKLQFNISEDHPTELTINYKQIGEIPIFASPYNKVSAEYALMIEGGPFSGYYISMNQITGRMSLYENPNVKQLLFTIDHDNPMNDRMWEISDTINMTNKYVIVYDSVLNPTTYADSSIWNLLGNPISQEFTLCIFPLVYVDGVLPNESPVGDFLELHNYVGDIVVTINQENILNKLTYYVNEDFMNTDMIDIDFFDLGNENFTNGFLVGTTWNDLTKSILWTSEQSDTPQPLMDIFARDRFRRYCRTIHKLKGKILHDGYMKPFSILTDDNLMFNSEYQIKLLLQRYSWDLNNGVYDIEAVEYTEEEILMDESEEVSSIPTGLWINQPQAGEHMVVNWLAVSGATGYILQRMPYSYNPGYNNDSFKTIYTGANITFNDDMQNEPAYALLANQYTVYYKVSSYNANGTSFYCAIVSGAWYK